MQNSLNITVTGANDEQREAVSNILTNALSDQGFTNIALVTAVGEPMVGSHVPSLLTRIQEYDPQFLATPIHIRSIPLLDIETGMDDAETLFDKITTGVLSSAAGAIPFDEGGIKGQAVVWAMPGTPVEAPVEL